MRTIIWVLTAVAAVNMAAVTTQAREPTPTVAGTDAARETDLPGTMSAPCGRLAAGTKVELEIAEPLSSSIEKRGDRFTIKLHSPLVCAETTVVPAGISGIGEIVHADVARSGGKPGELLLAARYLEFGATRLPLRGLAFGAAGTDKSKLAIGVAQVIGPFAQFIRGRNIEIPAGTIVTAKLAQDIVVPANPTAPESFETSTAKKE